MPVWVWLFFVIVILYGALVLWRAWRKKYVRFGPIYYTAENDSVYFWFLVITFTLSEIFAVLLFVVAFVSAIWGPIFEAGSYGEATQLRTHVASDG